MNEPAVSARLEEHYRDYYTRDVSEWRRLGAIDKANNIVRLCAAHPHRKLLEIGAGEGSILAQLDERRFAERMYALELSASGVQACLRRNLSSLVECCGFDGAKLPYPDGSFDLAILSHVIEHVEHPRQLLYEAARVARGVFVEVPLEDTIRLPRDFVFDATGHINSYSSKTFRRLLQSCHLEVSSELISNRSRACHEYQEGIRGRCKYVLREVALRAAPKLAPSLFTYHMSALCRASNGAGS